jgi:hypothetical protein
MEYKIISTIGVFEQTQYGYGFTQFTSFVGADSIRLMETEVNKWIERGYIPIGGLCVSDGTYFQAMIKQD